MRNIRLSFFLLILFSFSGNQTFSQSEKLNKKGEIYAYWGWNRSWYSNSDIHFNGDNYDFTLHDVVAKDRQTPFALNPYFHPGLFSIPQFNFRIGYFFHEKYAISFGDDHMKYVMQQGLTSKISGEINNSGTKYDGKYDNNDIILSRDFLTYEHTDGLNYLNIELERFDRIVSISKIKTEINLKSLIGVGALMPKTNSKLLNYERKDEFHFAGYGLAAGVGLNFTFFKHFFIQTEYKVGFINMPDIRTTIFPNDLAQQHFWFTQWNGVFGASFNLTK